MHSCALLDAQYRQVGRPSQSSQAAAQFTNNIMRNQQAGTANNACQYSTANTGVRPPQNANFSNSVGAYSHGQRAEPPLSSRHGAKENYYYLKLFLSGKLQHPTNTQSVNPSWPITYGFLQNLNQNSAQNSSTQSQHHMLQVNATYPQQDMSAHWNQSDRVHGKQSIRIQKGMTVSNVQHNGDQNSLFGNLNVKSTTPILAYSTTATSPPYEEVVDTAAHNRRTAHNNNPKQNDTQQGPPPPYHSAISQSLGNHVSTRNSPSSGQNLPTSISLSKTDELPLNHTVDTQQEMLKRQAIAKIEDYLRTSSTADSDGHTPVHSSSVHRLQRFVSSSMQNMQPVTLTKIYNSNASRSIPLLPKTTYSVMSTQHSVDVPPQQRSVQNAFHVPATGDGSGNGSKAANAFFPQSLDNASQLMQLHEGTSLQTQSSVAKNHEMVGVISPVKANDSSVHLSPGRTRAVAVVQPLSQDSQQVASKQNISNPFCKFSEGTMTDESLGYHEKLLISMKNKLAGPGAEPCLYLENTKQMGCNTSATRHSAPSSDGTFVSSSDSAGPQNLLQKLLSEDDVRSELAIDMQAVAPTALQSVTSKVPTSQSSDKDKSEMSTDPKGDFELSSVPTTPWTHATLTKLIEDIEKAQMELKDSAMSNNLLLSMFWGGDRKKLIHSLAIAWFKDVMCDSHKFIREQLTTDSVILTQVKSCFREQLKSYHVLKDNEVYSQLPYKSSWLNVNEQLDDIDKEFDFPLSLKHRLYPLESHSQTVQDEPDNSTPAQIVSEVSNKMLSSAELEPLDSSEEKQDSTVEATSTQTSSPDETKSTDYSNPYSFKIQILSPEEAKAIYEQAQSKMPESMDMDSQQDTSSPVECEQPMVTDATLSDTKQENKPVCPIEEFCCIAKLKEIIWGSGRTSLSKCQCKQSQEDITDKTTDEMAIENKDQLPERKFHSTTEGENQAKGGENTDNQVVTLLRPELCNKVSHTIDFTEDDDKLHSYSDEEPKNISRISIKSSQSSFILLNENKDHLSGSENEIPGQMPDFESEQAWLKLSESSQSSSSDEEEIKKVCDTEILSDPEVDCVQDQLKSTGNKLSRTWLSSDEETEQLSDSESDNCEAAQMISTDVSSLETEEEQTQSSLTWARTWRKHQAMKRKKTRQSSHDRFFPICHKPKKCKSLVDVDSQPVLEGATKWAMVSDSDSELSAPKVRTVELALFGSTPQQKSVVIGSRKSNVSSLEAAPAAPSPPNVLTVNISPLKKKSTKTVKTWDYSVKQLYRKWRISLPQTETEDPLVSSEVRKGKTKPCLSLKRRRSSYNELKHREEKTKKHAGTINQPADQGRNKAENGSHAVKPLQNKDVLKFTVLPQSFSFKDGSNGRKETSDPAQDKRDLVEATERSHNKTIMRARGTWYSIPEKCSISPPAPKTNSVFHEFQNKYMKKKQLPMAE